MNLNECLSKMVAPGTRRPGKYREGVIQIHVTRACDKSCFACTQFSNLAGHVEFMSPAHFEQAVRSLGFTSADNHGDSNAYYGVVGVFGGNPAMSPHFYNYCEILRRLVPYEQRGLWCNSPRGKGLLMRETFCPSVSNINVHLDQAAHDEFRRDWPEVHVVGLHGDSRHVPAGGLAMRDVLKKPCHCCTPDTLGTAMVGEPMEFCRSNCPDCHGTGDMPDYETIWEKVSNCDINQHWSAMIGVFRGELRAYFCEIAGAQAMIHQHEPDYPDTGTDTSLRFAIEPLVDNVKEGKKSLVCTVPNGPLGWWQLPMGYFSNQVKKHCSECAFPLRGYGELSQAEDGTEQTSATHAAVFKPKRLGRKVQVVTDVLQLGIGRIQRATSYLQNAKA